MKRLIKNPVIGHQIQFLQTAEQTNDTLLRIEYGVDQPEIKPAIPLHYHNIASERFEVVKGKLGVLIDGESHHLNVGEEILIPTGTPHTFWNAGVEPLRFITDVRPPGQLQTYWETVFGLATDGKVGKNGLPNLLQLAVVAPYADSYTPGVPLGVAKAFIGLLAFGGRLVGYKARYPKYSD